MKRILFVLTVFVLASGAAFAGGNKEKGGAADAAVLDSKLTKTITVSQDSCIQGVSGKTVAKGSEDSYNLIVRDWAEVADNRYPGSYQTAYLLFNIPPASDFDNINNISKIKIKLHKWSSDNGAPDYNAIFVSNMNIKGDVNTFNEETVTFVDMQAFEPIANKDCALDFINLLIEGSETIIPTKVGWVEFNVTEKIKQLIMANQTGGNIPFLFGVTNSRPLRMADQKEPRFAQRIRYYSKDYSGGRFAPAMVIELKE